MTADQRLPHHAGHGPARFLLTSLAGAGAGAAPLAAGAQQAGNVRRVGLLTGGSEPGARSRWEAFRETLGRLGHVEGQSIALEYRYGNDSYDRLPTLAADLVRLNSSVIVANGAPASLAAKQATRLIPIVMLETADPVGSGLVASLARPGGNLTGVAQLVGPELFGKQVEILKEVLPKLSRAGLLFNPANPVQQNALISTRAAAQALGLVVHPLPARNSGDFEAAFATVVRDGLGALIVTRDNVVVDHPSRLAELAARHRVPAMYGSRPLADAGGLIAYGPDPADMARRAATYVDRLIINARTAKTLGLTIPPSLLARADHIIE